MFKFFHICILTPFILTFYNLNASEAPDITSKSFCAFLEKDVLMFKFKNDNSFSHEQLNLSTNKKEMIIHGKYKLGKRKIYLTRDGSIPVEDINYYSPRPKEVYLKLDHLTYTRSCKGYFD